MNTVPPFPDTPQASTWFYADADNIPQGPFAFADLQRLAAEGVITPETQVIAQGGQEWMPFQRLLPLGAKGASEGPRRSFTEARWVVVLFLFAFSPLGLLLLWRSDRFERRTKQTITSFFVMAFALIFAAGAGTPILIGIMAAFSLLIWWKLQLSIPSKALATVGMVAFGVMMLNRISEQREMAAGLDHPTPAAQVAAENTQPAIVSSVQSAPTPVAERPVKESVAYKLASLDAGYPLNVDEPIVKKYGEILKRLSVLTGISEEMISSRGWMACKELKTRNVRVPALVLMKDTFAALSADPEGNSFDAVLAAVTILKLSESRSQ